MTKEINDSINRILESASSGIGVSVRECEGFLNRIPGFTDKHTIEDTRDFLEFLGILMRT